MIGNNRIGSAAYTSAPAIVQKAEKDWRYYESTIVKMDKDKGLVLQEYKEGGTWKQHYASWDAACVPFDISGRHANRLIQLERKISDGGTECPDSKDKKESVALKQVEKAREEPSVEPKQEEPAKPAVHSADEKKQEEPKPQPSGHPKPKENGKPKLSLAVWREMEETLIGRSLNRADELNRQCPNPQLHAKLIASLKAALLILEQWKASVG